MLGSVLAGLSQSTGELIACRVVQGLGAGGLTALVQVIMAAMISPRERGRYSGYLGAVMAVGTIGGPLIGGVIVDTSWLGWRWCFYVGVPFAIVALVVLQKTLHLPVVKRKAQIDWWGATLITAAVSLLLIWVSLAGDQFAWVSWQTAVMVVGALVLGALAIRVETRAAEPIDPAATVPQPHHHPRRRRQHRGRRGHVRRVGLPRPVLPDQPRAEPDHVRPDDPADDPRPAGRPPRSSGGSSPTPAAGSGTWSPARRCSPSASR